jgi:EAL domain-containing protein (putative c-di-GMP-specific phosphodiesterase class I)
MIELVLDIARFLGVPVVAEGVETEEQMKLLKDARCELVQGFYFSRPLPAEEFEKLIVKEMTIKREA